MKIGNNSKNAKNDFKNNNNNGKTMFKKSLN